MTTPSASTGAESLTTWSAVRVPHGTALRQQVDANSPGIRLVIGDQHRVELSKDPLMAGRLVQTLRAAVREYNIAHGFSPSGPDAA